MQVIYQKMSSVGELGKALANGTGKQKRKERSFDRLASTHTELVAEAEAACARIGWELADPEIEVSHDRAECFARWKVATAPPLIFGAANRRTCGGPQIALWIGVREKDADVWLSERSTRRKTGPSRFRSRLHLPDECDWAVSRLTEKARSFNDRVTRLTKIEVGNDQIDSLLFASSRAGLMPFSRLKKIDTILKREQRLGDAITGWGILTAFATVAKQNPPHEQARQVLEFSRRLLGELGIEQI